MTSFTNSALLRSIGRNIFNALEIADNSSLRTLLTNMIQELNEGKLNMIVPQRKGQNYLPTQVAPAGKIYYVQGEGQELSHGNFPFFLLRYLHQSLKPAYGDIILCEGFSHSRRNQYDLNIGVCIASHDCCVNLKRTDELTYIPDSFTCLKLDRFFKPRHWYSIQPPKDEIRLPFTLWVWADLSMYTADLLQNLTTGLLPTDAYQECFCSAHCGCEEYCFCQEAKEEKKECQLICTYTKVCIFAQHYFFIYEGNDFEECKQLLSLPKLLCSLFSFRQKKKISPKENTLFFSSLKLKEENLSRKDFEL